MRILHTADWHLGKNLEGQSRMDEQEQFLKDATAKAQGLLKWSPYKEYSDRINIYAVQTVSSETGVGVMYGESNPDTYFHVQAFGKSCYFAKVMICKNDFSFFICL